MAMTKERKGEIAVLWVKAMSRKEQINLNSTDFKRTIHNKAKEVGISPEEAMEFTEMIVREAVEELFANKK